MDSVKLLVAIRAADPPDNVVESETNSLIGRVFARPRMSRNQNSLMRGTKEAFH